MGNHEWGLGLCFIVVTIFLVATTDPCLGARNTTVACFEHERLALVKFKASVSNDYGMLSTWVGDDCCRWERVTCDRVSGNVESLHLRGAKFYDVFLVSNEISTSLAELSHLKHLDLSRNIFYGSQIPKFIGSLKQLSYLNLSYADLTGIIPPHIGNLSNLKILDLSSNSELMAHDMAWIAGLSSLEHLDLGKANLSMAKNLDMVLYMIPSLKELGLTRCGIFIDDLVQLHNLSTTLSNIKYLDVSGNIFKGQIPHFFQNMTSLQFLDLSFCPLSLTSNFVNFLNMIPSVSELHLSACNLNQSLLSHIHYNFTTLPNIQHLDLSLNKLTGSIPESLGKLELLRVLNLESNELTGSIPESIGKLELLRVLNLESNELTGSIPESLGKLELLRILNLESNELTGSIPESIGKLELLRVLNLESNELTGSIPESLGKLELLRVLNLERNELIGSIPESIGKLELLQVLYLQYNELTGSIPESLGKLELLGVLNLESNELTGLIPTFGGKLTELDLSNNHLSGSIPVSIGRLTELRCLDVSYNSMEGVVNESHFANHSMLEELYLAFNTKLTFDVSHEWLPPFQLIRIDLRSCKITNGFPWWLRNQRKLQSLVLSNTTISGPLPTWWRKMPVIRSIDLSHNNLSGPLTNLPSGRGSNADDFSLQELSLQNNMFNESIPRSLCKMTDLYFLDLSKNRLTGKIPNCFKNLQNLEFMKLSSNELCGAIPSFIGQISNIKTLNLNDNKFSGEIPVELWNLSRLIVLDLGDNALCGKIPEWIGEKVESLGVFRLHNNNFTGRIPPSLCTNLQLQVLDVAHNSLTGTIPHCLGELQGMVKDHDVMSFFNYTEEELVQVMKGISLEYTTTWSLVRNMDLSSNNLIGEIPGELTALSALLGLNLSNNHLSGSIPHNIGNMSALNSLDLSGNELNGLIPPSIADLNFLSHLNLSNNNLSGRIPTGNQLQTLIDPSIYAGNKDLCGAPLPKNCSNHEEPTTTPESKHEAADELEVWFYLDITCGFVTGFWGFIMLLVFKKQWRHKFFMFAEEIVDKIHVAVMVRVNKMKRGREAI